MEKAVGEVFGFNGAKLQVKDTGKRISCDGCYFNEPKRTCDGVRCTNQTGECFPFLRVDGKNVIFVEVDYDKEE